jgi:hypothetical protein
VALVAGRKRVPRPAAGITALVTAFVRDVMGCTLAAAQAPQSAA